MKNDLEGLILSVDNKLESVRDNENMSVVNYIQESSDAKVSFIVYLVADYLQNNPDYKKFGAGKYLLGPPAVSAGVIATLYSVSNIPFVYLLDIMLGTLVLGNSVLYNFLIKKRDAYIAGLVRENIDKIDVKQKVNEFYKEYSNIVNK